jgi:hypothetical protein
MAPPEQELERRRPVWNALSSLFLDTELDDDGRRLVAQTIAASGYALSEIRAILWEELYPVVRLNLCSPVGVWSGFELDWLQNQILSGRRKRMLGMRLAGALPLGPAHAIRREWEQLLRFLPEDFSDKSNQA